MVLFFCRHGIYLFNALKYAAMLSLTYLLLSSVLEPHSEQARPGYDLLIYFFIAGGFILLVVSILTVVFLFRYREKKNEKEPQQVGGNRKTEVVIIAVPLCMVIFFFILTVKDMKTILPPDEGQKPDVVITAHQWWWEINYPGDSVSTANEIHLPVGKKILLHLVSADVIHDWWVPELGNKMDIVPGRTNHIWLTINDTGRYEGACSEFCGKQHARMLIHLYADTEDKYRNWLREHRQPALYPTDEIAQKGAAIFQTKTCGSCHMIKGTAAVGTTGPELTHLASRHTLLTGVLDNNKENLQRWLHQPQKIKPGAYMPDFFLDKSSREALVTYLMQLK